MNQESTDGGQQFFHLKLFYLNVIRANNSLVENSLFTHSHI